MNSSEEQRIRETLRAWKVSAPLPPSFQSTVWRGIAARQEEANGLWETVTRWLLEFSTRPALAGAYVAVLLLVGAITGYHTGARHQARSEADQLAQYVRSIDPYQNLLAKR